MNETKCSRLINVRNRMTLKGIIRMTELRLVGMAGFEPTTLPEFGHFKIYGTRLARR